MFPEFLAAGAVRGPDRASPIRDKYEMSTVNISEWLSVGRVCKFFPVVK